MSEAEIRELCEKYINRPFDDEDVAALHTFLNKLQRPKVKKSLSEAVLASCFPDLTTSGELFSCCREERSASAWERACTHFPRSFGCSNLQKDRSFRKSCFQDHNWAYCSSGSRILNQSCGQKGNLLEVSRLWLAWHARAASISSLDLKNAQPASTNEVGSSPRHSDRINAYTANLQSGSGRWV